MAANDTAFSSAPIHHRSVLIAHPGVNPFVRHSTLGLQRHDLLHHFCVCYLDHPDYSLSRFFKEVATRIWPPFVDELERRAFHDIPMERVRTYPFWELLRTFTNRYLNAPLLTDWIWETQEHRFDRWVANQVDDEIAATYTYEHAGLETIRAARRQGIPTFHEQPSQHHAFFNRVYREQTDAYPELRQQSSDALHDSPKSARRNARRDRELALADFVLCNSSFTKRTLIDAGTEPDKIVVTPYGFPSVDPKVQSSPDTVTFLNAGTQNLRKGMHLLYDAWRQLKLSPNKARLWLIGRMELPESLRRGLPGDVSISDSIPHRDLMERYKKASVFVLPSLADGFGMVITEAMSRGVPVITTENTGGPDIITHGEDGFIIPPNDIDALKAQMQWCIEHKHQLPDIGTRAVETARSWQWSDYEDAIAAVIQEKV